MYPAWRIFVLGLLALLPPLPVTLPVPVLRELAVTGAGHLHSRSPSDRA